MSLQQTHPLSLRLQRYFEADPERLFEAWLNEAWINWLPPRGATCVLVSMHPEVGGTFLLNMTMPDERTVRISGRYLEIERPRKIVMTWTGSYDDKTSTITVKFDADGPGTLLTLHQEGFANIQLRDGYHEGWTGAGGAFDKLTDYLGRDAL